ncbi:MAG: protein kinase [Planctomycetota bacterium]|nr:protein kinase [Planctomycetota bacterium]
MGKFRIESLLIEARRGPVYRAVDEDSGAPVALRMFHKGRFAPEGHWSRVPQHTAIGAILETGKLRGRPYAVMEWMDGPQLSLAGAGLDPQKVLPPLLDALSEAHNHGILHGHLRAHNIHMEERGPVIADYGFRYMDGDDEADRGFVAALAPEQIPGLKGSRPASDVYGLGVIAYALLAGRMPFEPGQDMSALVRAILEETPPPPPGPAPVVQVVMEMLAKDPHQRISTWNALDRFRAIRG